MEIQYYKVLGEGLKTREGFQWKPGEWNIEPNAVMDGQACGIGLHVWKNRPQYRYIPYLPDHTYRVIDVDGLCGEDGEKSRFRAVKLAKLPMTLEEILGPEKDGLFHAELSLVNLSDANLSGANLSDANLYWANLSDANLYRANLSDANLYRADLSGANLSDANLSRADLSWANLSRANLSWANLSRANLSDVNLSGADLSEADLSDANLSKADLSDANLSVVNLFQADLSGANLSRAHYCKNRSELSDVQRKEAHC